MKALVYQEPGKKCWTEVPKPSIERPTDAIVRVLRTTICGTDLHIIKGDVPEVTRGRVLGHEAVGVVERTGAAVTEFRPGDHVIVSCITACGRCKSCKRGMPSHCVDGGWILGHTIDGTQAEYVRVPHADGSLHRVPPATDQDALVMLSDVLPTSFECGVLNGGVKPGDSVAIVGAGPIGLAALMTAQFYSPASCIVVDTDENRLDFARRFGATSTVRSAGGVESTVASVLSVTGNEGTETVIEAVGTPAAFSLCEDIVAAGGRIANIGVHGKSVELKLERLWARNITITTRLVDAVSTPMLLKTVVAGKLEPKKLITHEFTLDKLAEAYEVFGNAAREKALKVLVKAG